jgi:hypothetical protein
MKILRNSNFALAFLLVAMVASLATTAHAAGSIPAPGSHITAINISNSSDVVYFTVDGTVTGQPACATLTKTFAFDITTDKGKAYLSVLIAAELSGKLIRATGTGTCTLPALGSVENLAWLVVLS